MSQATKMGKGSFVLSILVVVLLAIGSISMTDQSDDEFDHDNLVEAKVGTCIFKMIPAWFNFQFSLS